MTDMWNAKTYSQFLDLRTKPAKDLLFAIPETVNPTLVYDLGCGPGNSTILLKERWPKAEIVGLDSSTDMLIEARAKYPNLDFIQADLSTFSPTKKLDCIFANASLQWVHHHELLIPKLLSFLNPGGILAIQIPNNWHHPSHQMTIELLEKNEAWKSLLKELRYGRLDHPFYDHRQYYNILSQNGASHIQLWETEYVQEMLNHQAIFNWVQGTGLRPVLTKLEHVDQIAFETAYVNAIQSAYPLQSNGKVLFPFRRFFMLALHACSIDDL